MAFAIPAAVATGLGFTETGAAITAFGAGTGGTILSGLGTGLSAFGAIQQGNAAASSANYQAAVQANNAQIAEQNARYASQSGEQKAAAQEMQNRAKLGAMMAEQGASGVDVNKGSLVDTRQSAAELGQLDAMTIRANAARQAYGYQVESASDNAQSQISKFEAKNAKSAGLIGAATTVLGGALKKSEFDGGAFSDYSSSKGFGNLSDLSNNPNSGGIY